MYVFLYCSMQFICIIVLLVYRFISVSSKLLPLLSLPPCTKHCPYKVVRLGDGISPIFNLVPRTKNIMRTWKKALEVEEIQIGKKRRNLERSCPFKLKSRKSLKDAAEFAQHRRKKWILKFPMKRQNTWSIGNFRETYGGKIQEDYKSAEIHISGRPNTTKRTR